MAAVHQRLQSHARTRSGQAVAANSARPLQVHQQAAPSNQHGVTNVPISSPLSLFLTNVKLLDLDLLPDWPGISRATFDTGSTAQGQKKRIQSVEWVLFRLFSLWDPEETANVGHPTLLNPLCSLLTCTEIETLLSSPRPGPVSQPSRRHTPWSRAGQEEWNTRSRCCPPEDHVGRMQG